MKQAPNSRTTSALMIILMSSLGLFAAAPAAFAQVAPQILAVNFENILAVPLLDSLTAGIALLLAGSAVVAMRRQTGRAGRLFGWVLALLAGTTLVAATGQRIVSDAGANVSPAINLAVNANPGTLDVSFFSASPLGILVTNNTSQPATLTGVTLGVGKYSLSQPTTCTAGVTVLPPGGTCTITLLQTSCASAATAC